MYRMHSNIIFLVLTLTGSTTLEVTDIKMAQYDSN